VWTERRQARRRAAQRRRRLLLAATVGVGLAVWTAGRELAVLPPATTTAVVRPVVVPGVRPELPWPPGVHAAVAVPSAGVLVTSGPEEAVPIASLTKVMTAYVVLRDHPLPGTSSGPELTMTAADVADAANDAAQDDTEVPVSVGERLSERQLLQGLLVHSANDFADVLARWDAGSIPAFVGKMNAEAAALGMRHTRYADASGVSSGSVSTAADQLRLAARAMAVPAFAAIDDEPTVTLPLAGTLANYVSDIGTDGVVGVKSGFTQAAQGCLVLAAERAVDGQRVLVLAAVTGQGGYDALRQAQQDDLQLADATAAQLAVRTVLPAGTMVAELRVPWSTRSYRVRTTSAVSEVAWPGWHLAVTDAIHLPRVLRAGAAMGTVTVGPPSERRPVAVELSASVPGAGWWWRLWR